MSAPTRLMVVTPSLSGGGAERFTSVLLGGLDRRQFKLQVCLMTRRISYPVPDDVEVISVDKDRPHHLARSIGRLRNLIREAKPDVVLSTMLYPGWLVGAALRGIQSRPRWVARFANPPAREYGRQWPLLKWLTGSLMRKADCWVANSRGLATEVERSIELPTGSVEVAYNPVDFAELERLASEPIECDSEDRGPTIISVGRLTAQKRPDLLLEAFSDVVRNQRAALRFCGQGPLRARLQDRSLALGLTDSVEFLGFQDNPYRWMRRSHIFALTSDYEGLPNALIEAQGLGLPAVSTHCPYGPGEIIEDGVTGLLIPVGDRVAIAKALDQLIVEPEMARKFALAGRERVCSLFDAAAVLHKWSEVLSIELPRVARP